MKHLITTTIVALCAASIAAQQERPLAIRNARILTLAGDPIESGTVLIQDGRIKAVGAKAKVPAGAKVVDARGGTVMPGLVNAWSHAGLGGARRSATVTEFHGRFRVRSTRESNAVNKAGTSVADSLYARQDVFRELLEAGVTTLAIAPTGLGFPGQAARVALDKESGDGFVLDDDCYLVVACEPDTKVKQTIGSALDAGKKALEERKKPKEEPKEPDAAKKPTDSKPSGKPSDQPEKSEKPGDDPKPDPTPDPKPDPKPDEKPKPESKPGKPAAAADDPGQQKAEDKKDPNAEAIADLLDGKRRAFLVASTSQEVAHYVQAIDEHEFEVTLVAPRESAFGGYLWLEPETVAEVARRILIEPDLRTPHYTRVLHNPGAELREAGIEVGYLVGDSRQEVRSSFYKLIELVRHGADADAVLRGVTAIPAAMLGIEDDVGTIEKGKRANLLLFSGDPLEPTSRLVTVFYDGRPVEGEVAR